MGPKFNFIFQNLQSRTLWPVKCLLEESLVKKQKEVEG